MTNSFLPGVELRRSIENSALTGGHCRSPPARTYDYRCSGVFGSVVVVCGVFVWGVGVFVKKFFLLVAKVFGFVLHGVGGCLGAVSPCGVELPVVVRCRSRVRSEEPTGY